MKDKLKHIAKAILPKQLVTKLHSNKLKRKVNNIGNSLIASGNNEYKYYGEQIKIADDLRVYYGTWTEKWDRWTFSLYFEKPCYYTEFTPLIEGRGKNKRLYFHEGWSEEKCKTWYKAIVMEQDVESPHCYFNNGYFERNKLYGTVLDIGCAEGNFSLSVIDKVDKVYYFEPDEGWASAINRTFKNYADKLCWVKKAVGEKSSDGIVSIDEYFGNQIPTDISLIKMDIDGYEPYALKGMKKTLRQNPNAVLLVCAYHHQNDEKKIRAILEPMGYTVDSRKGYMLFPGIADFDYPYLRKGVLEAKHK